MLDRDKIEKSLLFGIMRDMNWEVLILNNITRDCFTEANYRLYDYIKNYVDNNEYPNLKVVANVFNIDEVSAREYLEVENLNELCEILHDEYVKHQLTDKLDDVNDYSDEMQTNPTKFIDRLGNLVDSMKKISYHTKSVDLLEGIEDVVSIDKANVISTGFRELDDILVGWQKGEELAVIAGRTGQGKSWLGLKFLISAAFNGYRVGVYSGEMSKEQLQDRLLCCAKPNFTSTKDDAIKYLRSKEPYIRTLTQKELRRKANKDDIEEFIIRDKLDMVVIDQLSLMDDNTSKPRDTTKTAIW